MARQVVAERKEGQSIEWKQDVQKWRPSAAGVNWQGFLRIRFARDAENTPGWLKSGARQEKPDPVTKTLPDTVLRAGQGPSNL